MDLSAYTTPVFVDLGIKIPYLETILFQQAWDTDEDVPIVTAFNNVSNVIGGEGDDFIFGNSVSNKLSGGPGDDVIYGRGGADVFSGGLGDDVMFGGMNVEDILTIIALLQDPVSIADQFLVSAPELISYIANGGTIQSYLLNKLAGDENVVSYADASGSVEVNLGLDLESGEDALLNLLALSPDAIKDTSDFVPHSEGADGHDYIVGIHNVTGSDYDDILRGNLFDNTIKGGARRRRALRRPWFGHPGWRNR